MGEEELQLAPMHRIIKKAELKGVSEDGAEELRKVLEKIGIKISKEAIDFAVHAGRKNSEVGRRTNRRQESHERRDIEIIRLGRCQ